MKTLEQFLVEAKQTGPKPGTFAHFKHHVQGISAEEAKENPNDDVINHHWDHIQKHYKPNANYAAGTDLWSLDLGNHESSDEELRRHYVKAVTPKGKVASANYGSDLKESADECPKCGRELSSDRHCGHCDHYVDKDGGISYPEDKT